jgi:hypothetical protein
VALPRTVPAGPVEGLPPLTAGRDCLTPLTTPLTEPPPPPELPEPPPPGRDCFTPFTTPLTGPPPPPELPVPLPPEPPLDGKTFGVLLTTGGGETGVTVGAGKFGTVALGGATVTPGVVATAVDTGGTLSAGAAAASAIVQTVAIAKTAAIRLPCCIQTESYLEGEPAKPSNARRFGGGSGG